MTTTHVRIIRCHCRTCGADYTRWRPRRGRPGRTGPDGSVCGMRGRRLRLRGDVMPIRMRVKLSPSLAETLPLRDGLRAELPRLAKDLAGDIRRRTSSGRDASGRRFARKANGQPSNLTDSGKMIASFRPTTVTDTGFVLAPTGPRNRKVAAIHMNTGRPWIGVTPTQVTEAVEHIATAATGKQS